MNFRFSFTFCLISTCLLAVLTACSVAGSFQPIPPMFQNWEKSGATPDDVKNALLICGYDNPFTGFDARKEVSLNERARITKCMRDDAFFYLLGNGDIACDQEEWRDLSACVAGGGSSEKTRPKPWSLRSISPQQCYGRSSEDACRAMWRSTGGFPVTKRIPAN